MNSGKSLKDCNLPIRTFPMIEEGRGSRSKRPLIFFFHSQSAKRRENNGYYLSCQNQISSNFFGSRVIYEAAKMVAWITTSFQFILFTMFSFISVFFSLFVNHTFSLYPLLLFLSHSLYQFLQIYFCISPLLSENLSPSLSFTLSNYWITLFIKLQFVLAVTNMVRGKENEYWNKLRRAIWWRLHILSHIVKNVSKETEDNEEVSSFEKGW